MAIVKRYHLRKDEIRGLLEKLSGEFEDIKKIMRGAVEVQELDSGGRIISVETGPVLMLHEGRPIPLLAAVENVKLKKVVVDMGAVPFVTKGADIMAPGIVAANEKIEAGEIILIVDERHGKPLAIGRALVRGAEIKGPKGKVVKNLHHVGDDIWKSSRKAD